MYPAVVGAAIGGMLFAAIVTVLLLVYIIRNRNNNPRESSTKFMYYIYSDVHLLSKVLYSSSVFVPHRTT